MKRFLALLITFAMLLSAVPAFANETTVTVTSTFNNTVGAPIDASVPLTFSENVELTKDMVNVSPEASFNVSGQDKNWTVDFADLKYETKYEITVNGYNGTITFTTQFNTTKDFSTGKYNKGTDYKFDLVDDTLTAKVDVRNARNQGGSYSILTLKDTKRHLGISLKFYHDNADTKYDQKIELSYTPDGTTWYGPANEYSGDFGPATPSNINCTYEYTVTVSNNRIYIYWTDATTLKTKVAHRSLDFTRARFSELGFEPDTWSIGQTNASSFYFGFTNSLSVTSSVNNMKGVPVDATVPLTYASDVTLNQDDITVSPRTSFTLSGSGKNYYVNFTNMQYGTDYTISIKGNELVKFSTEYKMNADYVTTTYTAMEEVPLNDTKNFTVKLDCTPILNKNATDTLLEFWTSDKQQGMQIMIKYTYNGSNVTYGPQHVGMNFIDTTASNPNWRGPKSGLIAMGTTDFKYTITYADGYIYIYWADKDTGAVNVYKEATTSSAVNFGNGEKEIGNYKINSGVAKIAFGSPSPVKVTSASYADGKISATAAFADAYSSQAVLIFAVYNNNGNELVDIDVEYVPSIEAGNIDFEINNNASSYKLFVLDSIDNLTPVYDAVSGTINK